MAEIKFRISVLKLLTNVKIEVSNIYSSDKFYLSIQIALLKMSLKSGFSAEANGMKNIFEEIQRSEMSQQEILSNLGKMLGRSFSRISDRKFLDFNLKSYKLETNAELSI